MANNSSDGRKNPHVNSSVMKMLCPFYSVGAIIGKNGEAIKGLKEKVTAHIDVSKNDIKFPGTEERVVTIQGDAPAIRAVIQFVQDKIRNDAKAKGEGNEQRKQVCKLVVADTSAGRVIGKGGDTVKSLKDRFKVRINTSKKGETPDDLDERIVGIEGEYENVDKCLDEIMQLVIGDPRAVMNRNTDYSKWQSFVPVMQDRGRDRGSRGGYNDQNRGSQGYQGGPPSGMQGGPGGYPGGPPGAPGGYPPYPPTGPGGFPPPAGPGGYPPPAGPGSYPPTQAPGGYPPAQTPGGYPPAGPGGYPAPGAGYPPPATPAGYPTPTPGYPAATSGAYPGYPAGYPAPGYSHYPGYPGYYGGAYGSTSASSDDKYSRRESSRSRKRSRSPPRDYPGYRERSPRERSPRRDSPPRRDRSPREDRSPRRESSRSSKKDYPDYSQYPGYPGYSSSYPMYPGYPGYPTATGDDASRAPQSATPAAGPPSGHPGPY